MSAVTAYYLNEMNDKLQGISEALANQKFGLGEWKSSTGTIPAEDLEGRTILVIATTAANSGGAQTATSFIPINANFNITSVTLNTVGTAMNFLGTFTSGTDTVYYPVLTYQSGSDGTVTFTKASGSLSIDSTFNYTAF